MRSHLYDRIMSYVICKQKFTVADNSAINNLFLYSDTFKVMHIFFFYWEALTFGNFYGLEGSCSKSCNPRSDVKVNTTRSVAFDGIMTWKHFQYYWAFLRGILRSPVDSPDKGPVNSPVSSNKCSSLWRMGIVWSFTVKQNISVSCYAPW